MAQPIFCKLALSFVVRYSLLNILDPGHQLSDPNARFYIHSYTQLWLHGQVLQRIMGQ